MKVQLFARLKELAGRGDDHCNVPAGSTVTDVWRAMTTRYSGLMPFSGNVSCALNGDFAKPDADVHDGDEVAFLPPVSGG